MTNDVDKYVGHYTTLVAVVPGKLNNTHTHTHTHTHTYRHMHTQTQLKS